MCEPDRKLSDEFNNKSSNSYVKKSWVTSVVSILTYIINAEIRYWEILKWILNKETERESIV